MAKQSLTGAAGGLSDNGTSDQMSALIEKVQGLMLQRYKGDEGKANDAAEELIKKLTAN